VQNETSISFGDHVRVRASDLTTKMGLAGLVGQVYGQTTPSQIDVEVIGALKTDYAVNVYLETQETALWFSEDLLEFVDHGQGTEVTLDGVPRKWTRTASGEWVESKIRHRPPSPGGSSGSNPACHSAILTLILPSSLVSPASDHCQTRKRSETS